MALRRAHHALLQALLDASAPRSAGAAAGPRGGSVQWGGQQFSSPAALVAWANARGAHTNVPDWLARHPGAAAIFAGVAPPNYAGAGGGAPALPPGVAPPPAFGGTDAVLPGGPLPQPLPPPQPLPLPLPTAALRRPRRARVGFLGAPVRRLPRPRQQRFGAIGY